MKTRPAGEPHIPFNRPEVGEEEAQAAARAVLSGHLHGNGPISKRVEKILREVKMQNLES